MLLRWMTYGRLLMITFLLSVIYTCPAYAVELVEDVEVTRTSDGYEVRVYFVIQMLVTGSTDGGASEMIRVQLQPLNFNTLSEHELDLLREKVSLSWDHRTGIPLQELVYEGGDAQYPVISFLFSEFVEADIRSSADLRSLIVRVKSDAPLKDALPRMESGDIPEETLHEELSLYEQLLFAEKQLAEQQQEGKKEISSQDEAGINLMNEARQAMVKEDYSRAVRIYTKVLKTSSGAIKKQAQEFLGVARERKKQFAHARAEYEKFLKDYPEGPDADRVRQRLAGIITATKKPKARLKEKIRDSKQERQITKEPEWRTRYYGSLSQIYFYDQTTPEGEETQINRSDIDSNVDLNGRWHSKDYDIRTRFSGGYRQQFKDGEDNEERISGLSVEMEHKPTGLSGKAGRQTYTSGGVLGRFDGVRAGYQLTDKIKLNGVFGFPVESTKDVHVETEKKFYGVNVDLETGDDRWGFNTFAIMQENAGITDRQAIGGEARYFDSEKSFFTLVDYDVYFNALNIFLLNGQWKVRDDTSVNVVLDRRKSPLLTVNNAIQGQGVTDLADLFGTYSESELKTLAQDRTADSTSATLGVTHDISDDLQASADITVSELEGTTASGGVETIPGTGMEYFYSAQLIANNMFLSDDSIIYGLRYADTQKSRTYTAILDARLPYERKLRFRPKLRLDYREDKEDDDKRYKIRPSMRVDYRLKKWLRLEAETGGEWLKETSSGMDQSSVELFSTIGYRATF